MIKEQPDMSTKSKLIAYQWLKNIHYFFLPGTCVVCMKNSLRSIDLCVSCESRLPTLRKPCLRCALPLPPGTYNETSCGACLTRPPSFLYTLSAFEYTHPFNRLIGDFKYHGKLCNGKVMASLLAQKLKTFYQNKPLPEMIIPVPLHQRRLRQRGYNQASELGKYLSRKMQIPLNQQLCTRIQNSPAQMGLSAAKRRHNLRRAFEISSLPVLAPKNPDSENPAPIKRVAIIDDVITTMTTVTELSNLLKKNGVNEIHIWSIARSLLDFS